MLYKNMGYICCIEKWLEFLYKKNMYMLKCLYKYGWTINI